MNNKWTPYELEILRRHLPDQAFRWETLQQELPNRTKKAIKIQADNLGLHRVYRGSPSECTEQRALADIIAKVKQQYPELTPKYKVRLSIELYVRWRYPWLYDEKQIETVENWLKNQEFVSALSTSLSRQ